MSTWYERGVFYHMYPLGMTGAPRHNDATEVTNRFAELLQWILHIRSLGCNAIYIGPLFESTSHGYDTRDYKLVDGRLGTNEDFREFTKLCHENGIKVVVDGELPENVMSKDIILSLIGDLGADGATYRALEFTGSTVKNMTVASRMTMANMAIEAGAKCALFTPDEKTAEYCGIELNDFQKSLSGDTDATYIKTITYRAEDFVPVMACPSQVDKIRDVSDLEGTEIDQVFIGSCTNGRLEDLKAAAEVLKGKKVAKYVKLIVTPASRKIYRQAIDMGIMDVLAEAGAIITHPGCGLCCGRTGGILTDGERVVATNNRNFLGRMGTSKVEIYLASPKTAAACAVAGKIVKPE